MYIEPVRLDRSSSNCPWRKFANRSGGIVGLMLLWVGVALGDEATWNYLMQQGTSAYKQRDYIEATARFELALTETFGFAPDDPRIAGNLNSLADSYRARQRYGDAESNYRKAIAILEKTNHSQLPRVLLNLGDVQAILGQREQAEASYRSAQSVLEKANGPGHPSVAAVLTVHIAPLYRATQQWKELATLYEKSLEIVERVLGPGHSSTGIALRNLAVAYERLDRFDEAEALYRRILPIWEKALGAEHGDIAIIMSELAQIYLFQNREAEAEKMLLRSLKLLEQFLGADHVEVGYVLRKLAGLCEIQNRQEDAEAYRVRSVSIFDNPYRNDLRGSSLLGPDIFRQSELRGPSVPLRLPPRFQTQPRFQPVPRR
jgi:tetratricopeptide (TPR) repeat protein